MSVSLCQDFKTWLYSLGFIEQNVSDDKVSEEFEKLSPPEMRDIWRNILSHVQPIQQTRYVRKVLLLEEFKKHSKLNGKKIEVPRSLKKVSDLEAFDQYERLDKQRKNRAFSTHHIQCRIDDMKNKISALTEKRKTLIEEKDNRNHMLSILQLKTKNYQKLIEELNEVHECLAYADSFWNSRKLNRIVPPSEETMKSLLEKVNEFGKRRCTMSDAESQTEIKKLLENIFNSTVGFTASELQKTLINLLGETVGTLLKLTDHLNAKKETHSNKSMDRELTEMRKQYVQTFIDCRYLLTKVKTLEEKIQKQLSQVISLFSKECNTDDDRRMIQTWLDTEHLRHQMTSRYKYLLKMEIIANNENISQVSFDLTNSIEREKFFKSIFNYQNQMVTVEQEISNNLNYLSEKSIDMFLNCQKYCKSKISEFIKRHRSTESVDFSTHLFNALKKEVSLLEILQLQLFIDDNAIINNHVTRPDNSIFESTRKCNFHIHLKEHSEKFENSVNDLSFENDALDNTSRKIRIEEKDFVGLLYQLLEDSKNNLRMADEEAESCTKNVELWTNFSINELIPRHLVVEDHTFSQWQEKYRAYTSRLSK